MFYWIIIIFLILLILFNIPSVEPFNNVCDLRRLNKEFNKNYLVTKNLMSKDGNIKGVLYKKYVPYMGLLDANSFNRQFVYRPVNKDDFDFVYRDNEYHVLENLPYDDPEVADRIPLPYYKDYAF